MDTIIQNPEVQELVKGVSLRHLLNVYFFFKPNVSQTEMGKRLNVGQMTISRMLTKEYAVRDEWIPTVFDMMCEVDRLGIREYVGQLQRLAQNCKEAIIFSEYEDISSIICEQILHDESEDFERTDISVDGFKFFSWDEKLTWAFVRAQNIFETAYSIQIRTDELSVAFFPKRTDRVTFYATDKKSFEMTLQWYSQINWNDSATDYLRAQRHSIAWVDLEQKTIKKHIECKPGINSNLYQHYLDEEQSDT